MRYCLVEERLFDIDIGEYKTYGIELCNADGSIHKRISDIDTNRQRVEELCRLCNELKLSEIHFEDVIEDYLAK